MSKPAPYKSFFGGKAGSGTYQTIINHMPPHDNFFSVCAGWCGITRNKLPARWNVVNDLDTQVYYNWLESLAMDWPGVKNIEVRNENAIHLIRYHIAEKFDTAATLVYIDPPYLMETRKKQAPVYKHEMTTLDHQLLLTADTDLKHAMVMISHYPNKMYDEFLAGWNTHDFYSQTRHGKALERIYYNYELSGQLHDYRYIGQDFRERERKNRILKNMMAKIERLEPDLRNRILETLLQQK